MNRKILCGVLALLLVLAVAFTGCQSNSSSSASGSGSTSGSDSGSGSGSGSAELEAVTLEYYMPEKAMTDAQMVWDEINKYVQEKINATVNIHWIEWAEYSQRMSAIIGAGQEFDLLASPTSVLNFAVNANNGAYAELDDLLTEYAPELLEEVPAFVLEGGKVNGKIYGVPSYKDVADSYSVIWYTDLAQGLGAQGLYNICTPVSMENAQPGDLIFFWHTYDAPNPNGVTHVGIYVGNGQMIHCGDPISYANINSSYWQQHYYGMGRLP